MVLISIDKRSTKADIIDSAQELIGNLEDQLDEQQRKSIEASEQRNSLVWLLLLIFTLSVLF